MEMNDTLKSDHLLTVSLYGKSLMAEQRSRIPLEMIVSRWQKMDADSMRVRINEG